MGSLGRRKSLSRRPSLGRWSPGSLALVLVSIGSTSFDGAQEGLLKTPITDTFDWFTDLGLGRSRPTASTRPPGCCS